MTASTTARCTLCPRGCQAEPGRGFCAGGGQIKVASVTLHRGEEPVIGGPEGVCNVFFAGCNLRCLYCQNHQISRADSQLVDPVTSLPELVDRIVAILDRGIDTLGFVSPSHMVAQLRAIALALHRHGYFPTIVYNSNGYDRVETLRSLEGLVDVYLPDMKYLDRELAGSWSAAAGYPEVASAALREMYRQKGNQLRLDDCGRLRSGMVVRHLVLPGAIANSLAVLRFLAEELSPRLAVSIMAQYRPTPEVRGLAPLNRRITDREYRQVVEEVERLGFTNGWLQEFDSADHYNPDFTLASPFGEP